MGQAIQCRRCHLRGKDTMTDEEARERNRVRGRELRVAKRYDREPPPLAPFTCPDCDGKGYVQH